MISLRRATHIAVGKPHIYQRAGTWWVAVPALYGRVQHQAPSFEWACDFAQNCMAIGIPPKAGYHYAERPVAPARTPAPHESLVRLDSSPTPAGIAVISDRQVAEAIEEHRRARRP